MSTITISYGRKIPGPQDYSSESLHITLTQDLGEESVEDGDLRSAIGSLYQLAKEEVDQRLRVTRPLGPRPQLPQTSNSSTQFGRDGSNNRNFGSANGSRKASPKQVTFLLSLANQRGVSFDDLGAFLEQQTGKRDPYELTTAEASSVIDQLKG